MNAVRVNYVGIYVIHSQSNTYIYICLTCDIIEACVDTQKIKIDMDAVNAYRIYEECVSHTIIVTSVLLNVSGSYLFSLLV